MYILIWYIKFSCLRFQGVVESTLFIKKLVLKYSKSVSFIISKHSHLKKGDIITFDNFRYLQAKFAPFGGETNLLLLYTSYATECSMVVSIAGGKVAQV